MSDNNTFGKILKLTTFGESHGECIGGVLQGVPSNILLDIDLIQKALDKRKPAQSKFTSQRKEDDKVKILSGIFEGKTTGQSIGFLVENINQKSKDYENIKDIFRPSHADFTYEKKYRIRDYRGGGRASARETISRVVGGAIAKQIIPNIKVTAYISSVGDITINDERDINFFNIEKSKVNCPNLEVSKKIEERILEVKKNGDSIGGIVTCVIKNVPIGLGDPVFDKLEANLAKAMMSIPASKGFEIGSGFSCSKMLGSEHNDSFNSNFKTDTNNSGGIQGGISNGMDIYFNIAFKPTPTIFKPQKTINKKGEEIIFKNEGRHDPCVAIRAVSVVEAMAYLVLADSFLLNTEII